MQAQNLKNAATEISFKIANAAGYRRAAMSRAQSIFSKKRLIFCVTNGRTGTKTLAALLNSIDGLDAVHEPSPPFHSILRPMQTRPRLAEDFYLYKKLPAIDALRGEVYAETSHLFAKGFVEPLIELGCRPSLIFLSRSNRSVASSMYTLNDIPGRSKSGLKYYLNPTDANLIRLPENVADLLSDYQLCYWHAREMEARQAYYKRYAVKENLISASITTDGLNRWADFEGLAEELDLPITSSCRSRVLQILGGVKNKRSQEKSRPQLTSRQMAADEAAVEALIEGSNPRDQECLHFRRGIHGASTPMAATQASESDRKVPTRGSA